MKANRRAREAATGPDAGVSSVVAAVLLFALFSSVMVLWTLQTLPQWVADREQSHQDTVQQRLAGLKASLDTLSAAGDPGPVSAVLPLGARPVSLLQRVPSSGSVTWETGWELDATFSNERVLFVDGSAAGDPDQPITSNTVTDIQKLRSLVVSITTTDITTVSKAWVQASATDGTRSVTVQVTHDGGGTGGCSNPNSSLTFVVSIDSNPDQVRLLQCSLDSAVPDYRVDLLDTALGFAAGLGRLDPGFTLTMTEGTTGSATVDGYFSASYLDTDGLDRGVGTGQSIDYTLDVDGGRVLYVPRYQSFVQQSVVWEGGALLLRQSDSQGVAVDPAFQVTVAGGVGYLRWTVVLLEGTGSRVGTGQANILVAHESTSETLFAADGGAFTITSSYAGAWRSFLDDQVLAGGASSVATVGGAGSTATLTLSDSGVTEWVVRLRVVQASVTLA